MARPMILNRLDALGFTVHEDGQPNVIAARGPGRIAGNFDDILHVVRKVEGEWVELMFSCTADPGRYYMINPMNQRGCAIVQQGQWKFRLGNRSARKGGYRCLVQAEPISVWRDANLDDNIDQEFIEDGWYGIQLHRASERGSTGEVGRWSAGCIVVPIAAPQFEALMTTIEGALNDPADVVLVTVLDPEEG